MRLIAGRVQAKKTRKRMLETGSCLESLLLFLVKEVKNLLVVAVVQLKKNRNMVIAMHVGAKKTMNIDLQLELLRSTTQGYVLVEMKGHLIVKLIVKNV